VTGPAGQIKTWNLSCVHRLPTGHGAMWLKTTGPEQTREEVAIAAVARHDVALVPEVIAADPANGRVICAQLPGRHLPDADHALAVGAVDSWVAAQAALAAARETLVVDGVPHRPLAALAGETAELLTSPMTAALTAEERNAAGQLLGRLPELVGALEEAGLPETLVHGDFTPVNWHGSAEHVVLLDWSDAYVGHPAHDLVALLGWLPPNHHDAVTEAWCAAWRRHLPGSRPELAARRARPLVHLYMATVYARFLAAIEPAERCYHEDDPPAQIRLALAAAAPARPLRSPD
jgi:aminoglycoside/choline kinase family phosphotransferase